MAFRIFIDETNGQVALSPGGSSIYGDASQFPIYKLTTDLEWQFGGKDFNGAYQPKRKPDMTTFAVGFFALGTFTGTAAFGIDPTTVVRPSSGTGVGYLTNFSAGFAVGDTEIICDGGSGTILAGDEVIILDFRYTVSVALSMGHFFISTGLQQFVGDNIPINVDAEAGFYTAKLQGNTVAGQALLDAAPTHDDVLVNGQMTWFEPGDDTGLPPRASDRIYALYKNTFDISGVSPSVVTPGFTFLITLVGITGGGLTKLDGIPTIGKGYSSMAFNDKTTSTGFRVYELGLDDSTTVGRVATSDDITKVWYPRN